MDRYQRHSQIAYSFQQSKQRRLILYEASQERMSILFQGDRQAREPVVPLIVEVTPDPDLEEARLTRIAPCEGRLEVASSVGSAYPASGVLPHAREDTEGQVLL
jgi:hypothetical protein